MKIVLIVFAVIIGVMFSGCVEKIRYVPKPVYIYSGLPDKLLDNVNNNKITTPIEREKYMSSSPIGREKLLREVILGLYGDIGRYRLRLSAIKKFDHKQKYKLQSLNLP